MTVLNFMTAIFWGQLSHCRPIIGVLAGYSCTNRSAYAAVSTFAVFLFLFQLAFSTALVLWKGEILNDNNGYDEISTHSTHNPYAPNQFPHSQPSADL